MFASEVFEGSISDREIVQKSDILDIIEKDDLILADRGFTIDDLVLERGGKLLIPPFLNKKSHFSNEEAAVTRIVAKARIHIGIFFFGYLQISLL